MITFAKMGDGFVKAIMPQGGHDKEGNFHWDAIYFHADDEREYRDKLSVYNNSRQKPSAIGKRIAAKQQARYKPLDIQRLVCKFGGAQ